MERFSEAISSSGATGTLHSGPHTPLHTTLCRNIQVQKQIHILIQIQIQMQIQMQSKIKKDVQLKDTNSPTPLLSNILAIEPLDNDEGKLYTLHCFHIVLVHLRCPVLFKIVIVYFKGLVK